MSRIHVVIGLVTGLSGLFVLGYVCLFPLLISKGTWMWALVMLFFPLNYSTKAIQVAYGTDNPKVVIGHTVQSYLWLAVALLLGLALFYASS